MGYGRAVSDVALQAVMAQLLSGETIHHACGIPAFRGGLECHEDDLQRHMDVAKKVLQWRWLFIDEISMVSAKLLADIDTKLRSLARDVDPYARDEKRDATSCWC